MKAALRRLLAEKHSVIAASRTCITENRVCILDRTIANSPWYARVARRSEIILDSVAPCLDKTSALSGR